MGAIAVVLGVLAAGLAVCAAWLLNARARLVGELSRAMADLDAGRAAVLDRDRRIAELAEKNAALEVRVVRLEGELDAAEQRHTLELRRSQDVMAEQVRAVEMREREFKDAVSKRDAELKQAFAALSGEALSKVAQDLTRQHQAQQLVGSAELEKRREAVEKMVKPIEETLRRTEERLAGLGATSEGLKSETVRLVRALSKPEVRGRYGEIQLRRVAELAGMKEHCDFVEQESQRDGEGRLLRPDMVVHLPNDRLIAVDAKTNTLAYLEAANAKDETEREACLERFARHISDQVVALSQKQYWAEFDGSPHLVVMFVPGDQFIDAAWSRRPDLFERAAERNVILASPSTLIGLLRAVEVGWREARVEAMAAELFELGRELHKRASSAYGHMTVLGRALNVAVERFNKFVGSYQRMVEPQFRKFEEAGVRSAKEMPALPEVVVRAKEEEGAESRELF